VVSPATATVLSYLVLVLAVAYVPLASLVHQLAVGDVAEPAIILIFAAVGLVVARRQARNPVGWILLIFSLLFMFSAGGGCCGPTPGSLRTS
jgi:hypothetical protein